MRYQSSSETLHLPSSTCLDLLWIYVCQQQQHSRSSLPWPNTLIFPYSLTCQDYFESCHEWNVDKGQLVSVFLYRLEFIDFALSATDCKMAVPQNVNIQNSERHQQYKWGKEFSKNEGLAANLTKFNSKKCNTLCQYFLFSLFNIKIIMKLDWIGFCLYFMLLLYL